MIGKIKYIVLFLLLVSLTHCANQVAPTGGAKDTTPPMVVEAQPANHSTDFNGRRIEITFDEYITLNNASQQVLFSPPLQNKPDIKLSNKTVVIKFKEDLRPNTTYTIDFGEAVKDFHEGNLFKDYSYSFSTDSILDTLSLSGTVLDAATQKPLEKLFVGLYADDTIPMDSLFVLPCRQAPDYLARTDKEGNFHFHGLPDVPFLVVALEDMNSNLYYDLPNEKIGFLDTLVCPSDSVSIKLAAFTEVDTTQMLLESKLVEEGLLRFAFRRPADSVDMHLEWPTVDSFQVVEVWSAHHDTLSCWFTPNVADSVGVHIHFDTLINIESQFNLKYRETQSKNRNKTKELKVGDNLKNKMLIAGEDLLLRFTEPVVDIRMHDTSMLIAGPDTLYNIMDFEPVDNDGMVYRLVTTVCDTLKYTLQMADSVFHSVRGRTNNAFTLQFKRAKESDMGNIFISVAPPEGTQVIIQLLDNKDKVLDTRIINDGVGLPQSDSTFRVGFTQLVPDKYKLQAIIDIDRNGQWSPGNFHQRFLPERIIPYKDVLDVKAGWDIDLEEVWEVRSEE